MKRIAMRHAFYLLAIMLPRLAPACSPSFEPPFWPETAESGDKPAPVEVPAVRVVGVHRGPRGDSPCSEIASIVFGIKDPGESLPNPYMFELVSGNPPDELFSPELLLGRPRDGERLFTFYWAEFDSKPRPFEFKVRVTSYSRTGARGASTTVVVASEI